MFFRGSLVLLVSLCACCSSVQARDFEGHPRGGDRTADQPDSWLVLYNLDNAESVEWAEWYQAQRLIPVENMIGLHASLNEHLDTLAEVQEQIVGPVRALLDADETLRGRIMGILTGFGLPGHYASAPAGGPGGFSVADALQDMYDDNLAPASQQGYNLACPQFVGLTLPANGRMTKSQMAANTYMVARIDAPSLDLAKAMTLRAKNIENPNHYIDMEYGWYDYSDPWFPQGIWPWLRDAVIAPELATVPWHEFDSDLQGIFLDAFRVDTHDLAGWNNGRLDTILPGARIFAYNFNSVGAATLRSTTDGGGRFVPNAIASGYASGIGSTSEPQLIAPFPKIFIACLAEGWTAGESFFLANPMNDWMWTFVGDPFMRVPHWFDESPPTPTGTGDINSDGQVNGQDILLISDILLGGAADPEMLAAADMSGDGIVNDDDAFLILGPSVFGTPQPDALHGTGDLNFDNRTNGADLNMAINIVVDNGATQWPLRLWWAADMDLNGQVTQFDLGLLVERILTISPDELPDPPPEPIPPEPEP